MSRLLLPPKFVTEDLTGIRHEVDDWLMDWEHGIDFRVITTKCGKLIALGGQGNEKSNPCPKE